MSTARALEVILSRVKFDPETTRILKYHLAMERDKDRVDQP